MIRHGLLCFSLLERFLGLSLGGTYSFLDPIPGKSTSGFDNMEVSLKYVFWQNAEHETLLSAGVSWDVGGTGSKKIGAESLPPAAE